MKKNTLTINIRKPVAIVFQFILNPKNTPKWVPSVLEEKTSEPIVKIGTIYSQKINSEKKEAKQTELVVTCFIENKRLDFHLVNGKYSCSYRYKAIPKGTCLTYSEENGVTGKIESPMTSKNLRALKKLIEKNGA